MRCIAIVRMMASRRVTLAYDSALPDGRAEVKTKTECYQISAPPWSCGGCRPEAGLVPFDKHAAFHSLLMRSGPVRSAVVTILTPNRPRPSQPNGFRARAALLWSAPSNPLPLLLFLNSAEQPSRASLS